MHSRSDKSKLTADQLRELVMRVANAVSSHDAKISMAGQVGRELIDEIIAFRYKVIDPVTKLEVDEIDIETPSCIIEVTNESDGSLQKLRKLKNDPLLNPRRKKVVLYAPNYSPQAARDVIEESIPVIQSLEKLSAHLKKIKVNT